MPSGFPFHIRDKKSKAVKNVPQVVAFSGGRTSGLMLRRILDAGEKPIVLFANTGKERDETLDFVHHIDTEWGVGVVWLEYTRVDTTDERLAALKTERMRSYFKNQDRMHWFRVVDFVGAARHRDERTPFDELLEWMSVLPNSRARACTSQLKVRTMQRYLWSRGIYSFVNHIGFRADEPDRAYDLIYSGDRDKDVRFSFPLCSDGTIERDVREWWSRQSFDLRLDSYEGNCHLCFLKRRAVKQRLIREQPALTAWWREWEERKSATCNGGGAQWRAEKGHKVSELERDAASDPESDDGSPAMECACNAALSLGDTGGEL